MTDKVIKGKLDEGVDSLGPFGRLVYEASRTEGVEDGVNSFMPQLAPNDDVEMLREAGRSITGPPHTVESARVFDKIYAEIERNLIARGRLPKTNLTGQ